jgi:hypothetical protein
MYPPLVRQVPATQSLMFEPSRRKCDCAHSSRCLKLIVPNSLLMQKFLQTGESSKEPSESVGSLWLGRVLGFVGSAVIFWIVMRWLAPALSSAWGISWIDNFWTRLGTVIVASAVFAELLLRIEGTIWAKYYVIVGYLLSLVLIIWIILRLLHYV